MKHCLLIALLPHSYFSPNYYRGFPPCTLSQNTDNKETEFSNVQGVQDENGEDEASGFGSATHQVPTNQLNLDASRHFQSKMVLPLLQLNPYQDHRSDRNKLAKLKRHASRVHFAKIHLG